MKLDCLGSVEHCVGIVGAFLHRELSCPAQDEAFLDHAGLTRVYLNSLVNAGRRGDNDYPIFSQLNMRVRAIHRNNPPVTTPAELNAKS
jgi:hypothetical protein